VKSRNPPLSQRLRALQSELASLEEELSDPSNPLLQKERDVESLDPGELIRGLVDVRGRLEKIRKEKEGRSRLVGVIIGDAGSVDRGEQDKENQRIEDTKSSSDKTLHTVVDMDRRVGELEKLVGASSATLDEVSTISNTTLFVLTAP
jgi:nuclear migration protein JNM1